MVKLFSKDSELKPILGCLNQVAFDLLLDDLCRVENVSSKRVVCEIASSWRAVLLQNFSVKPDSFFDER